MSLVVYWASYEDEWMLAKEPKSVLKKFYENYKADDENYFSKIQYCPSFEMELRNTYALHSLYNYKFDLTDNNISSNDFDQTFFNNHVLVRSYKDRFFSFKNSYIFFTEENSLNTSFYQFPFFEQNNITERCIPVPGQFDIGKWFRHTEFPFFLKKDFESFFIEQDEVYCYIKFHTKEKVVLKQFVMNDRLKEFDRQRTLAVEKTKKLYNLENYYKMQKNKKLILKEIKENLV